MNSNAIHNILNIIIWGFGLLGVIAAYAGCTALPDGSFDCTTSTIIPASWLPTVVKITTGAALMKTAINFFRDGFGGMWKPQPKIK
ncbi:hypothetical protein [Mesorhizobium sp. IMUNJ 23232]|uniref:hypothetical protein n=1 Tax=Mesorhizobium sp. IMUNJ 23232 TaxID=3376064 RepID=UPI00379214CF